METPKKMATIGGPVAQKTVVCPYRSKMLYIGTITNRTGHADAHSQSRRPVPRRLCKRGNAIKSQVACDAPVKHVQAAMRPAEKPRPPMCTGVYWATGKTAVNV